MEINVLALLCVDNGSKEAQLIQVVCQKEFEKEEEGKKPGIPEISNSGASARADVTPLERTALWKGPLERT